MWCKMLRFELAARCMPNKSESPFFSLENFEGPLDLLLYLIQKEELDVREIPISEITTQLLEGLEKQGEIDTHAESLGFASSLLLLKSRRLFPQEEGEEKIEGPLRLEMLEQLLAYTQLKEAASGLARREEEQRLFFPRSAPLFRNQLGPGLDEISLSDLSQTFTELLKRAEKNPPATLSQETWEVDPKIALIRSRLKKSSKIPFSDLFSPEMCREELIVTFLALLELMKLQEALVIRENQTIMITCHETSHQSI
ncbi:MAG: Segregation and condensation protein A [Chlamydiae bacterium]|nr:Segregation and condensation protein A [Chlamydiota bacterium]